MVGRNERLELHSCLIRASTKMNTTPIVLFCSFALLLAALQPVAFASKCSDHLLTLKASDGQDSYGKCPHWWYCSLPCLSLLRIS